MIVFVFEFAAKLAEDPHTPTLQRISIEVLAESLEQAMELANREVLLTGVRKFQRTGTFQRAVIYHEEPQ